MLFTFGLCLLLFTCSCDDYQGVTFENQTPYIIQVDIRPVPLDYQDTQSFAWNTQIDVLKVGESKKFVAPIQKSRSVGVSKKYTVVAGTETNEIVYYKIFTWDELYDINWYIEITQDELVQPTDTPTASPAPAT